MNKSHRIGWSESRQAVVADDEKTSANRNHTTRTSVLTAVVSVALMGIGADAVADSICQGGAIVVSGTETLRCSLDSGDSLTVTETGRITPGSFEGVYAEGTNIVGITNSGVIASATGSNAITLDSALGMGFITNNATGRISGDGIGIFITSNSTLDALTNSGRISGGTKAIYVDPSSTLSNIFIAGNDSARFVGAVEAQNTPMSIANGATYTFYGDEDFLVDSFTNNGTARFDGASTLFNLSHVTSRTFVNSGVLQVTAGSTGTLTHHYTQDAAGIYRVNVTNDTTYGKLVVGGTATLPSNAKIDVNVADPNFRFTATSLADIISADTLISDGTFAVTDNSLLFNFDAVKDGITVDLTITAAAPAVLTSVRNTGNIPGTGAGAILDAVISDDPSGPVASLFVRLTNEQQVSNAVSQTLPLLVGGSQVAASAALTGINRVIQARQEANRGLSSGEDFYGDKKFWMKPFGSWADQNDRKGVSGYKASTSGLAFGADATISDQTRLGLSFTYAKASVDGKSSVAPNSAQVDVYQLVGYGSHAFDQDTELNFQVGIGQNKNEGKRHMTSFGQTAEADYSSLTATAGAGLGRTYSIGEGTRVAPSIRADYTWIKDKGYTETGAGALNLDVRGRTSGELILAVDGKVTHQIDAGTTLTANLGIGYDVLSKQSSVTAAFAGAPGAAFTTQGLDPSPWLVRGGLGIVKTLQSGMELTARYDVEYRQGFLNQTASVKARWTF